MVKHAPKPLAPAERALWYGSIALVVYMPFHVFLSQSLSLLTGGLSDWKVAKDAVLYALTLLALWVLYKQSAFRQRFVQLAAAVSLAYVGLHVFLFLLLGRHSIETSLLGIVYNARLPAALCIGMALAGLKPARQYNRILLRCMMLAAATVAVFGVVQMLVLPKNTLAHFGYSVSRGVKPMFYIDDKPNLPRVMSTLRDPNTLGAFLILPILLFAWLGGKHTGKLRAAAYAGVALMVLCLWFTYSRSALLGLFLSLGAYGLLRHRQTVGILLRRYWFVVVLLCILPFGVYAATRNTYLVKNTVLHEDASTKQEGSNGLHIDFAKNALRKIAKRPLGYGPGTAGLVSIKSTQVALTEDYYLQIGVETGVVGLGLFLWLNYIVVRKLFMLAQGNELAAIVLAAFVGLAFINLLLHMWSGEAVALYWWLLAGYTCMSMEGKNG